ncbi:hypothetical protein CEP52_014267 [Fusarium oligoseptatum]|uniref:Carboxylic ester hydrolase n=1 Tax=Fusarium oligoseptatum TaxID=2604345 RepID=A0A428SNS1_9HYPO|nr:hypothetical protein CEP52_014267 [Fusarium oligoseptatum]
MKSLVFSVLVLAQSLAQVAAGPLHKPYSSPPVATVKNGSYQGVHSTGYNQDFFLGIPYAQAPVGDLRFRNPRSYDKTWKRNREAIKYSPACVGYGPSQIGYDTSEDCLYLNVIRPSGYEKKKLPVAIWIHGGGYVQGSGVDLRYNLSFIVEQSVKIGHPIVAVSINYRLSAWGFLNSAEFFEQGDSNMGLRDQRLSLHWIHENIAAFGGDPSKVTIWGQSAGAASVGAQILAYNGRDDGLFRYFLEKTGCDTVKCLRDLSFKDLNAALNTTALSGGWTPKIDGDFVARHSSKQLADGHFVKVPIIVGATTDEGTSFSPKGINTTDEFRKAIENSSPPITSSFSQKILQAYPEKSREQILPNLAADWTPPASYGKQYRRTATYYGDVMMVAPRRLAAETWAKHNLPVYSFRFNAIPSWATYLDGATHFVEVAFAMLNLEGVGYPPVRTPPFQGLAESYRELSGLMASDWIKFVATGNPNGWKGREKAVPSLGKTIPNWPLYNEAKGHGAPKNFLYEGNVTIKVESDTWRSKGIALLSSANFEVYDR